MAKKVAKPKVEILFRNPDKLKRAQAVVALNGKVSWEASGAAFPCAEVRAFRKVKEANPKLKDEALVFEVYKELGGLFVEHEV